jgi:integrase/recombinase XerD
VPYSASTGLLLADYLRHRSGLSRARGPLVLSESRRNLAEPLTLWSWSKIGQRAAPQAEMPRLSTHTTRCLCLTNLARIGWEMHADRHFRRAPLDGLHAVLCPLVGPGAGGEAELVDDAD